MDPQVVRSTYEPNGDVPKCPICGMPLSVRKKGEAAKLPAGITGRVQLSPERIQLAGIKTVAVEYRPVAKQTKTVGYVTFDESRLSRIVSRVEGYVEKLYVDETFTVVHQGDPLAEIYSPELYSTARELVLATPGRRRRPIWPPPRGTSCCCLGVSQQEIDGIVASGQPSPRLVIRSPQTGYVVEKKIVVGVERGSEDDAVRGGRPLDGLGRGRRVREGHPVPASRPGGRSHGRGLSQSHLRRETRPHLSAAGSRHADQPHSASSWTTPSTNCGPACSPRCGSTRRWRASSRTRAWRPRAARRDLAGLSSGRRAAAVRVPRRARAGRRRHRPKKVVYVEREPGMFEGVEVELGPRQGDYYPVIKGLNAGRQGGRRGRLPDRRRNAAQPGGRRDLLRRQRRPAVQQPSYRAIGSRPAPGRSSSRGSRQAGDGPTEAGAQGGGRRARRPTTSRTSSNCPRRTGNWRWRSASARSPAQPLGSMGVPVKITLRGQTGLPVLQRLHGQGQAKPRRNAEETGGRGRQRANANDPSNAGTYRP